MNYDQYGQCWTTPSELCDILYQNPDLDIGAFYVKNSHAIEVLKYNSAVAAFYTDFPKIQMLRDIPQSIEEFDREQQNNWYMPREYSELDITKWLLEQCQTQEELQRIGQELLLFQERGLIDLLRYLKYFVDTMREYKVLWGLGRGSSVASYSLYLIGVHRVNSLYYDLDIEEFLK